MATNNNIKNYTAADIEKYHKGQLSTQERHSLEKAALDDPFLADALEGYAVAGASTAADLSELKRRLAQRTDSAKLIPLENEKNRKAIPWLRIAVMLVILVGAGILANQFLFRNNKPVDIAQLNEAKKDQFKTTDTTSVTANQGTGKASAPSTDFNNGLISTDKKYDTTQFFTITKESESKVAEGTVSSATDDVKATDVAGNITTQKTEAPAKKIEVKDETAQRKSQNDKLKESLAKENARSKTTPAEKREADKELVVTATENPSGYYKKSNEENRSVANNRKAESTQFYAYTYRGQVLDNNNRGVPFANVTNVRDNVGTYTDVSGKFTLTSPDTILDVQVRSVGLENNLVQLRNNVPVNQVVLQEDRSDVVINNLNSKKPNAERRRQDVNLRLEEPEPADGWDNYDTYLVNNLNVPNEFKTRQDGKQEVEVSFEVDKNGKPTNIRVEKSLCKTCDEEAKRLVKEGPRWKRKAKKGRTTVTITF